MSNILDDNFLDINSIKKKLSQGGIHDFYEIENQQIVVSESHTVRITIKLINNTIEVNQNFPQIGNSIQIILTAVLVIVFSIMDLPFSWGLAILLGQLFSYLYHKPKIKKLGSKVKAVLNID